MKDVVQELVESHVLMSIGYVSVRSILFCCYQIAGIIIIFASKQYFFPLHVTHYRSDTKEIAHK